MKFVYDGVIGELNTNRINSYEELKEQKVQSIVKVANKYIVNLKNMDSVFGEEIYSSIIIEEN